MKNNKISLFTALILLLAGCSSSRVTSSWKAPNAGNTTFQKIMVAAVLPQANRSLQQSMERELVNDLSSHGVQAISAYETYGPRYISNNETQAVKKLRRSGVDAVITIVLLDKNKETNYTPGRIDYVPTGIYRSRRFYGYYSTIYDRVYTPGYYTQNTNYFWESNLYDLRSGNLIYSAQSQSFDPGSVDQLAIDYSKKLVEDMSKQGLLAKK